MSATSFPAGRQDWKGRFIYDMAAAVALAECVDLYLWAPPGELPARTTSVLTERDRLRLADMAADGGIAHLLRKSPLRGAWIGYRLLRSLRAACRRLKPDLYHCNWLQMALALPDDGKPVLVTVLGTDFRLLAIPGMVALLRRVFRRRRVLLAPNAGWMVPHLSKLFAEVAEVRAIPFGVDSRWFVLARHSEGQNDWLVVLRLTRDKLGDLIAWGEGLFGPGTNRRIHLLGPMQEKFELPGWIEWHGPTNPDELREKWFPTAIGMITLSRHAEGRPQVLLEAMAAGLPVLASNIPAHADLLQPGETGYLCDSRTDFAAALTALENRAENSRVANTARQWIWNEIGDWQVCASRYRSAYDALLGQKRAER